eukprot:TRINITY_DN32149_c0_g1_i10.p1 TRINITY_DN32149_c0_g1~~TRINITY_DN32149_c0_g1_i10.p1  ORF type:complete len:201 (-),score=15.21 TRINITY_DN32149_c0_g1_i10:139-741(-)
MNSQLQQCIQFQSSMNRPPCQQNQFFSQKLFICTKLNNQKSDFKRLNQFKLNSIFNTNIDIPRIIDPSSLERIIDPTKIPRIITENIPANTIPYAVFVGVGVIILILADIAVYFRKWSNQTDTSEINQDADQKLIERGQNQFEQDSVSLQQKVLVDENEKLILGNKLASERNRGLWWLLICVLVSLYLLPLLNPEDALRP